MTVKYVSCVMEYDGFEIWETNDQTFAIVFDMENNIKEVDEIRLVSQSDLDDIVFPEDYDYCGEFFSEPTYGFYKAIEEFEPVQNDQLQWKGKTYDIKFIIDKEIRKKNFIKDIIVTYHE